MKEFNKQNLKMLRNEMTEALKEFSDDNDISIEVGNASFRGGNATFKVHLCCKTEDGEILNKDAEEFKRTAKLFYGLEPSDLGKEFTGNTGEKYTLIGSSRRSRKFPILGKRSDGKIFKFPVHMVKIGLKI